MQAFLKAFNLNKVNTSRNKNCRHKVYIAKMHMINKCRGFTNHGELQGSKNDFYMGAKS